MIDPIVSLLGPWALELNNYSVLLRISLACLLAALIGCERSSKRHCAGLRTFVVVTLAATSAMLLDLYLMEFRGSTCFLLSASSILGICIICVHSLLIGSRGQIKGLTTAAGLWACGMIGLAAGAGFYSVSVLVFLALLICLNCFPSVERALKDRSNHFEVQLELRDPADLPNFVDTIRRLGLTIDAIERSAAYADTGLSVYSIAISISSQALKTYRTHAQIIDALGSLEYIHHIEEMNP